MMDHEKRIPVNMSISRPSHGGDEEYISVELTDNLSRIPFCEMRFGLADFMRMLTSRSHDGIMVVRGLEYVGKVRETKKATFRISKKTIQEKGLVRERYRKGDTGMTYSEYLEQHGGEEGWKIDSYLGSQSSIGYDGDDQIWHYRLYRFVDPA